MNEIDAPLKPLKIERATLPSGNPAYSIKDCADELYARRYIRVNYAFLSHEDYTDLCREIATWHIAGGVYRVMMLYGMYVASLASIPTEQEYTQARLTFEYLEYRIPTLKQGEVLVLYEQKGYDL